MTNIPHGGVDQIYRDIVGGGDTSPHKPIKSQIRAWGNALEKLIEDGGVASIQQFGITPSETIAGATTDYTAQMQAMLNDYRGVVLMNGYVMVDDKITSNNACSIHVPGGRGTGGLVVRSTFNLAADCVLQPGTSETGSLIGDLSMWFQQPTSPDDRSDLIQYPAAIDIGDPSIPRGIIRSLRISNGYDGIKGVGNCGGYRFGMLELGCFNKNMHIDGALDFVHTDSIHVWPFGHAGNTDLAAIYYDGVTEALTLGRVDNWNCDKMSTFRSKIVLNDTGGESRLPFQFGSIGIDGNDALISLQAGSSQISRLYSTKTANAPATERDVQCSDGTHTIGMLQMTSSSDASVLCSGGHLKVNSGDVQHLNNSRRAFISQGSGFLDVSNVAMRWNTDNPRTNAFMEQQSGSTMRVTNCYAPDTYTQGEEVIKFNSDESGNLLDCPDLYPHTANTQLVWSKGRYNTGNQKVDVSDDGFTALHQYRKFSDSDEGYEIALQRSRGSVDAPAALDDNDNVGDISFQAWDGNSWNPGAYIRAYMLADAADGNTPMRLQFVMENTSGDYVTSLDVRGDRTYINTDISHNSDAFDVNYDGTYFIRARRDSQDIQIGATHASDGLFYPLRVDASEKKLVLGTDESDSVEFISPLVIDMPGAATDDLQFVMKAFRPHLVFEDKSGSAVDWQIIADNGDLEFLWGDASTGTKLTNRALQITDSGVSTFDGIVKLAPASGTEGGELRIQDASGNDDFTIDVDSLNNLRIRQAGTVVININQSGGLSMPAVLEYASDAAAASGGVNLGQFYVSTVSGALTKRRS